MVTEFVSGVYDITVRDDGNGRYRAHFFDLPVPTLVDTGLESTTDALFEGIEEIGTEPERVIITHGDGDHIGGLESVNERYDVETWVPAQTNVDDSLVDRRFSTGDTIGPFEAVHVPGHTPDHHALVDEANGIAVLGDAVFGSDARGLPSGYFVLPTGFYSANLLEADEHLERLLEFEFDVGLVYHGSSVKTDAVATLDDFVNFDGKPQ
ncbi:MBL fold metallo-hydrolase [Halostagnicola sp. A-GB9-2]|uniref:MBL fold metallo-hydrolase n=1 Tax=Halostagnicola sp. A-GB9-2 TaxID=3048066 RepID=UPI0024BFF98C|nr:MBL fold metallo-hydrolase [Halostagnicola sp. A-GB9-2]MDJ1433079.1 MBL fold metallo-hydrolase [Halostagnicola sp. A-GB9-2]